MPRRSKKHVKPTFSKTKKKDKEVKRIHMVKVRDLIDEFQYVYVFHCENFRNDFMKKVKDELQPSVFFMAKIAPTTVALGRTSKDEYRKNIHKLTLCLQEKAKGNSRGLFFTNTNPSEIINWFRSYQASTVPKTGFVATEKFIIPKGTLDPIQFNHSQEYQLRQLGLPVMLKHGQLLVERDYVVCKRGDILKPEQCRLLKLWNQEQAKFRFILHGYWSNEQFVPLHDNSNNSSSTNNTNDDNENQEQEEQKEIDADMIDVNSDQKLAEKMRKSNAFFENLIGKDNLDDDDDDDNDDDNDNDNDNNNNNNNNNNENAVDTVNFLASDED